MNTFAAHLATGVGWAVGILFGLIAVLMICGNWVQLLRSAIHGRRPALVPVLASLLLLTAAWLCPATRPHLPDWWWIAFLVDPGWIGLLLGPPDSRNDAAQGTDSTAGGATI
ncbi:MAG: hypothetical protein ACOCXJ_03180 [Planctomycetota bacterium]